MTNSDTAGRSNAPKGSPGAAGRDRGKRERLVAAARRVLYEHGVEKSALADIAAAADVPLGNVYYYFKTKDALVSAVIEDYQQTFGEMNAQLSQGEDPADRLKALLAVLTTRQERLASYGCPVGSLTSELGKRDDDLRAGAGSILSGVIDWAETQFQAMGRDDARELATALIAAYEGIVLLAAALRDPGLIGIEVRRLSRWIDSLAELAPFGPIATQEGAPMTPQPPRTVDLFVNGRWRPPQAGQYEPALSPVTGELIGQVAQGDRADADAAVQAAAAALGQWASATAFERARALHRVADACQRRRDELARALTLDQGKPLQVEAYPEVDDLIGYWHDAAEDVVRLDGAIPPSRLPGARVLIERRPLGVVAVITPWNWPYTMPAQVIAPALAAGNTVVWTPAPTTSVCSAVLVDAIADADLPPGAVAFLPGPGPVVGDEIAGHPRVAAVAFVGSTQTGLSVARRAAGKAQLLEMGNNGPLVVMDDADLDRAVAGTLVGAYLCAGQSCTAAERILVHERVHAAFVEALAAAVGKEVVLGDPFDPRTTMGPLNNADVAAKTARHVADALARGADLVTGGGAEPGRPTALYWQPTVLDNVPRDAVVAREETFGPVAPIIAVASLEDAIALTDDLPYGLMASIYTADAGTGLRYADAVRAAWVNINESSNYWETHLPFGGGGGSASGVGRVGGRYAMETLSQVRTVVLSGLT